MSTEKYRARINQVISEIAHDRITLPTLPDIAIKFQILVDDPDVTNERLAAILLSDQFILSQIMRAANSAALAGMPQVDNVKAALLRLGQRQVRNLVMSITMNKMFYSAQPAINLRMKQVLARSRRVAAISYVVAAEQPHLSADQAMLAGLMHNIGVLPLCLYIEGQRAQTDDDEIGQLIDDARKRNILSMHGWIVLVYWGPDIHRDPLTCARNIREAYDLSRARLAS